MPKQVTVNAKGNSDPNAGPNKTPGPTRPAAPDVISQARLGGDGYGQNSGRNNPSSIPPGAQKLSGLAANMKASVNDDGVLDHIIAHGTARNSDEVTGQLRTIASRNVSTKPGMKDANTGGAPRGSVPASNGASNGTVARKPGR